MIKKKKKTPDISGLWLKAPFSSLLFCRGVTEIISPSEPQVHGCIKDYFTFFISFYTGLFTWGVGKHDPEFSHLNTFRSDPSKAELCHESVCDRAACSARFIKTGRVRYHSN